MEPVELLRETGDEVRERAREQLPDSEPDEELEKIWEEALTGNEGFNSAVVGEEGTYTVEKEPDYAFLVDPLDGTSGAVNGGFPWATTTVAVLEDVKVGENGLTGKPCGSYIGQISGSTELYSWNGEASIDGEVRFTDVEPDEELPGEVDGTRIGPRTVESFEKLSGDIRKGIVSAYAAKKGRRPVREHFLEAFEELGERVRTENGGGSYTGASVGFGKSLVAGEPKPTVPTESAGEIFARAMDAESSDIYGDINDRIQVEKSREGLERTYTSIIAGNDEILEEAIEAVNVEGLEQAYEEDFDSYTELREGL